MLQTNVITTERMFEQLYRMAREVEERPASLHTHLVMLLRELYDPIEVKLLVENHAVSHVVGGGSTLVVPVPAVARDALHRHHAGDVQAQPVNAIALRYAHRGKRLFTHHDARLTDRVLEQLARAVAFDQAVERGRNEERERIAQDLHDDIGARLLTLMYTAPNREVEDYIRHTIHELKTLTRGLAAPEHRLSHAVAEWKADIANRLAVARCELEWSFNYQGDMLLNVVQWSAITRILRELITNTIAHGKATRVSVHASVHEGWLTLEVSDDGQGVRPETWSHGLGLGGVRKRVKQLAGSVTWRENAPRGIRCHVHVPLSGTPMSAAA
jgi:signal transduction histidine kinase